MKDKALIVLGLRSSLDLGEGMNLQVEGFLRIYKLATFRNEFFLKVC